MLKQGDGHFPTTQWTLIARLKSGDETESHRALNELCTQYHYPLYCYIRRRGIDHHDAQDVLHDYLFKLLRLETFKVAEVETGRLRSFLAAALQRFLINWHRDHGQRQLEVSDDAEAELAKTEGRYKREHFTDTDTPERIFERKWSQELLSHVLKKLGDLYIHKDREKVFEALRPVLMTSGSLRDGDAAIIAATLDMTEGTLRVALSRLLKDYRTLLREEVRQTVAEDADVNEEITYLLQVFKRA